MYSCPNASRRSDTTRYLIGEQRAARIDGMTLHSGDGLGLRVRPFGQRGHRLQRGLTEDGQVVDDGSTDPLTNHKAVLLEASQRLRQHLATDPTDRLDEAAMTARP